MDFKKEVDLEFKLCLHAFGNYFNSNYENWYEWIWNNE